MNCDEASILLACADRRRTRRRTCAEVERTWRAAKTAPRNSLLIATTGGDAWPRACPCGAGFAARPH